MSGLAFAPPDPGAAERRGHRHSTRQESAIGKQVLPAEMADDDQKHYRLGWRAGTRPPADSGEMSGLDLAEARYEKRRSPSKRQWNRWMDGYLDAAAGREFGHIANCPGHGNNECGVISAPEASAEALAQVLEHNQLTGVSHAS